MAEPFPAPDHVSRRTFLTRVSMGALAAYAALCGAGATSAYAQSEPPPCRVSCLPVSKTGCGCGGNLYQCQGCGDSFHACIERTTFYGFCLRRKCR